MSFFQVPITMAERIETSNILWQEQAEVEARKSELVYIIIDIHVFYTSFNL